MITALYHRLLTAELNDCVMSQHIVVSHLLGSRAFFNFGRARGVELVPMALGTSEPGRSGPSRPVHAAGCRGKMI
jgi:hypothetical protein